MKEDFFVFKRIWGVVKPFHTKFYILAAFLIVHTVIGLFSPYFFGKTIDELTTSNFNNAFLLASIAIFFWFLYSIVELLWGKFEVKETGVNLQEFFSTWSLNQIFKLSLGQFRGENSGYRQKIFEKGLSSMQNIIYSIIYNFGIVILRSIITTIALFFIHVWLGTIVAVAVVLYAVVIILINKSLKDRFKKNQEVWAQEGREYTENLRYLSFIKANSQEKKAVKNYEGVFKKVKNTNIPLWIDFMHRAFGRDLIVDISRGATLILGIWLTMKGEMTIGTLVIFFTWSGSVFNGLNSIGRFHRIFINNIAEVKKLFELLDEPSDVQEVKNPIKLEKIEGDIKFENVTFAYPARKKGNEENESENKKEKKKDKPVLRNVSFTIPSGKTTAFVGRSGSGKTTMINLLLRAYDPQRGEITINDINLRDLDLKDYRKKVGVVEQEVEVFDKTIKHNILFPIDNPRKFTKDDLERIAKDSGMNEFKSRLTHGFDTKIGEKGIQLSGGQKQRVGIARVLAKKPDVLIFDEATSNLDSVNEKNIHKAMQKALKGRTGIIIAHRLATVMDADRIIVMDQGKVAGVGTHQELIKDCEQYKELVNLQNLDLSE